MNLVQQLNKVTLLSKMQVKNVEKSQKFLTNNTSYFNIHDIISNCGYASNSNNIVNKNENISNKIKVSTLDKLFNKKLKKLYNTKSDYQSLFHLQNTGYTQSEDPIHKFLQKEDKFMPLEMILLENGIRVSGSENTRKLRNSKTAKSKILKLDDFGITQDSVKYRTAIYESDFKEMMKHKIVGIDAEYMGYQANREFSELCCTIQIATPKNVFVFPLYHFTKYQKRRFYRFFRELLISEDVMKLGIGLENDIRLIQKNIFDHEYQEQKNLCYMNYHVAEMVNFVDLQKLYLKSDNQDSLIDKKSSQKHICSEVLKKDLSKCDQVSYWLRNPLRKSQVHYAAMDAYILLELYKHLSVETLMN